MATQYFEIPLRAEQQQITITLNATEYILLVTWCAPQQYWLIELQDTSGTRIVAGIPLVTGADLLAQYEYLGIGGMLVAQTDTDALAVPTYQNLGDTSHLFFITDN